MPSETIGKFLREPGATGLHIAGGESLLRFNVRLTILGLIGAMMWGAAVGSYVGGEHAIRTLVKMPVFFAITLFICFALMHIVLVVSRIVERPRQTLAISLATLCVTTASLGALSPVILLFCVSSPIPNYTAYLNLYLACALCGALAGVFGVRYLAHMLRAIAGPGVPVLWPLIWCVLIYQFVGAQVAYILRPWIGNSLNLEGFYNLEHGLKGNFYTGVFAVFRRWLMETGIIT
ncbi:MAG: hypothetical protein L6Q71_06895 [Planctomycetes bacterium]|nr:hypothetical protein [Planctomycetota bacterium]NUQ35431.1 hypothetical protein [Planctomycetaceae bacterium]